MSNGGKVLALAKAILVECDAYDPPEDGGAAEAEHVITTIEKICRAQLRNNARPTPMEKI